jgi:hypothetical protein
MLKVTQLHLRRFCAGWFVCLRGLAVEGITGGVTDGKPPPKETHKRLSTHTVANH